MLRSSLCDYRDAYIIVSGTIIIDGAGSDDAGKRLDKREKGAIFKNCGPFFDYTTEINNTQTDYVKDLDVVIPMYNLIEYSNHYSKISGSFWK